MMLGRALCGLKATHESRALRSRKVRYRARAQQCASAFPVSCREPYSCPTPILFQNVQSHGTNSGLDTIMVAFQRCGYGVCPVREGLFAKKNVSNPEFVPRKAGFWNKTGVRHGW